MDIYNLVKLLGIVFVFIVVARSFNRPLIEKKQESGGVFQGPLKTLLSSNSTLIATLVLAADVYVAFALRNTPPVFSGRGNSNLSLFSWSGCPTLLMLIVLFFGVSKRYGSLDAFKLLFWIELGLSVFVLFSPVFFDSVMWNTVIWFLFWKIVFLFSCWKILSEATGVDNAG